MSKINIYVCENFYLEYKKAIEIANIDNIQINQFVSLCDSKKFRNQNQKNFNSDSPESGTIVFSEMCDMVKLVQDNNKITIKSTKFCFSNILCDEYIRELIANRNYLITVSWLRKWKYHIDNMGFDRKTARMFFQESVKQIVLLDGIHDEKDKILLKELAAYIDLPYDIIRVDLSYLVILLKNKAEEEKIIYLEKDNNELRSKVAEYAVIFDMFRKISKKTNKREIINKIKELIITVFGVQEFVFWGEKSKIIPNEIKELINKEDVFFISEDKNRICVKIKDGDDYFGTIDIKGFVFKNYLDKYLNLLIEISRLTGLILKNSMQYEKILKSEKELKYYSFHDTMTGLYNRTYINQIIENEVYDSNICIFMFDIDGLKKVNDKYGHAEGDNLIISFAEILKINFRESDVVARIGGDEFMAILYNTDENFDEKVKVRLLNLMELSNKNIKEKHLKLSASIGYARAGSEHKTIEDLMKVADYNMYKDKMRKKNNKCLPCDTYN